MNIYDRIKELANSQGISINKLEEQLGFARGYLYTWKRKVPGFDKVQKVADFFNISTDYLIGRDIQSKTNSDLNSIGGLFRKATHEYNLSQKEQEELQDDVTKYLQFRAELLKSKKIQEKK